MRPPLVVLVASRLERRADLDLDALASAGTPRAPAKRFDPMLHYASTKRANLLLARALREDPAVRVLAVSPGMVHTGLWRNFPGWYRALTYPVRALALRSAEEAAEGIVFAVASDAAAGLSGMYLSDGTPIEPSDGAEDPAAAARLAAICDRMLEEALGSPVQQAARAS